ncbi:MAG TPA: phage tail protein, partial [Porphyromonadaceae bacterium]|nr:phage tail protein [Porphyromonadaceae bacterium]
MANWFETKVRYDKTMENGAIKKVTEAYMVDALSFTEAEARISEEISHFTSEFSVSAVKRTKIAEIFRERTGDKWYLVKVAFITLDEKTAVEKKSISQILVAADSFKEAFDNFMEGM